MFTVKTITDKQQFITDVFISGSGNDLIANYRNPLRLDILELVDLYDALTPVVKQYKAWKKDYDNQEH